jgi:dipeptidyl aminopeptidase/acylaminoacyl peptidase
MKRVGTPLISPNGKLVVFSVMEPSYDSDEAVRDLWVVPADGSARARRLTSSPGGEGGVAWSRDSSKIAFSAKRSGDEKSQIYVLDMTGPGEAQRVTTLSTGARNPVFSPDGTHIAFESMVFPGAADEAANKEEAKKREERKYDASRYEGFPIRYWDHWLDDRQVHLFVQSLEPDAEPRDLLAGTKLVAEPGYSGRPGRSADGLDAVWTPDGQSLVFTATTGRNTAAYARVPYQLYQVGVGGGEPKPLTSGDASYGNALFTPDGESLLCRMQRHTEYVYNLTELVRFAWPEPGEPKVLTDSFDRSVGDTAIAPGGGQLYLLAADAGRTRVYTLPIDGGNVRALDEMSRGAYAGVSAPEQRSGAELVARWEGSVQPAEIVSIDPQTGAHTPLTSLNTAAVERIDWQPFREFWFTSSKGRRIHNWITLR